MPATRAIAKLPADQMQRLSSLRRDLELGKPWRIGCNDLVDSLRASGLEFEEFLESVEHVAFYMRSDNGEGIHKPRGWFMKRLAKGYFEIPAGFVSLAEKRAKPKFESDSEMCGAEPPGSEGEPSARVKEAFEAEFQTWESRQSDAAKEAIAARAPGMSLFGKGEGGALGKVQQGLVGYALRKHFAEEAGLGGPFREIYGPKSEVAS